jgi:ethanolamine ammonia-lyase large subunit
MDTLLTLLATARVAFVITVPGADDVMLGYQSLSFHDVLVARHTLGLRPAPEFEDWLRTIGMIDDVGRLTPFTGTQSPLHSLTSAGAS